jgi:protein TonB
VAIYDTSERPHVEAVKRVQPEYPAAAKEAKITGDVTVEIVINKEGRVVSARATSGHPYLREASEKAALKWRFSVKSDNDEPVEIVSTLTFKFSLSTN